MMRRIRADGLSRKLSFLYAFTARKRLSVMDAVLEGAVRERG
jgi:hypothetical protein